VVDRKGIEGTQRIFVCRPSICKHLTLTDIDDPDADDGESERCVSFGPNLCSCPWLVVPF
jgi:hypothetical protein